MIARIRRSLDEKEKGFTLIELLVVMIIIGILAAIAIPVFLSQRAKAQDSAAKADVSTLGKEIATWYVDGTGAFPVIAGGNGVAYTIGTATVGNASANVLLTAAPIASAKTATWTATSWCVAVTNESGDKSKTSGTTGGYKYSAAGGLQTGTCP